MANRQHANKLGACDDTGWWRQQRRKEQPWLRFHPRGSDQVLLGFRHGDPARPYVMGSLFNGTTGGGGGSNNSIKSLKTRSGISVILNDDNRSLEIKDAGGSAIHLMEMEMNLVLTPPKNIQLPCW